MFNFFRKKKKDNVFVEYIPSEGEKFYKPFELRGQEVFDDICPTNTNVFLGSWDGYIHIAERRSSSEFCKYFRQQSFGIEAYKDYLIVENFLENQILPDILKKTLEQDILVLELFADKCLLLKNKPSVVISKSFIIKDVFVLSFLYKKKRYRYLFQLKLGRILDVRDVWIVGDSKKDIKDKTLKLLKASKYFLDHLSYFEKYEGYLSCWGYLMDVNKKELEYVSQEDIWKWKKSKK